MMHTKYRAISLVPAFTLYIFATACSSSSSGSLGTKSAFIDAYCAALGSCCGSAQLPTDGVECHSYMAISPGAYDAALGQSCISELQAAANADANWCMGTSSNPSCSTLIASLQTDPGHTDGTRGKQGDACTISITNDPTGNPTFGIARDGDMFCSSDDGLYCDQTSKTCTPLTADGDPCTDLFACGTGETCNLAEGKCDPVGKIGDSCAGGGCVENVAYCDFSSQTCVAALPAGAACVANQDSCASNNCTGGACVASQASSLPGLQSLCGAPAAQ